MVGIDGEGPSDMFGHCPSVDPSHILFAVAQAASWSLCLHSSHKSRFASSFRQDAHRALSAGSMILFQYGPHFILLVSMFLMWSLRRGGTPRAFIPVRSSLFVGLRHVACRILFLASSSFSCPRMGGVFFIFHFKISFYAWWASRACSLAPS